ncbi:hypothetical protein [Microbacterium sp. 18062]|uniref:hypothetical protein n=1 Tax=Microbacterium sp. 18062 TaxID=2681410 RepID=UPI00135716CE|nr:hypothetical protein [Microbacterium sp. 18062]
MDDKRNAPTTPGPEPDTSSAATPDEPGVDAEPEESHPVIEEDGSIVEDPAEH